jgi:FkbM family methyltransferase
VRAAAIVHDDEKHLVRAFFHDAVAGFFVEVGANDPYERSQTWHLERLGWTGILVEPQPDLAAKLVSARTAMVFAVACSSPDNAGRTMPMYVAGPLSSLNRDRMAPGAEAEAIIDVPVRVLDDILAQASAPSPIDLLSIDVEGHEFEVLQGFDLLRWRPRLVLLEDHVSSLEKHQFLQSSGYRLVRRVGNNGWYIPASEPFKMSWPDHWEIWRKYFLGLPFRKARNALRNIKRPKTSG